MTTILITGVGRGIGLELARLSLERGWYVIGSVRRSKDAIALQRLSEERFRPVILDVRHKDSIESAAKTIEDPIDILVNNSGVIGPSRQTALDMDFDGFADTFAVNTMGPLRIIHAFLPHLRRSEQGKILTISSWLGSMAHPKTDRIAYRASKSAVNKLMQGLAMELAPAGIVVAAVHPGWVRTDMGGRKADYSPRDSAAGVLNLCDQLQVADSGKFWNVDGTNLPW